MIDLKWQDELGRLSLWFIPATLLGLFTHTLPWCWLALVSYFFYRGLRNLLSLQVWLEQSSTQEPPDLDGMAGQIAEIIYRQRSQDRQERVRQRATISYFRDSVKSLPYGVAMINADGAIEWTNDTATELIGLRQPQDVGQQLVNLVRSPDFLRYFLRKDYAEPFLMMSPLNAQIRLRINISEFGRGNRLLFVQDHSREYQLEEVRKHFVSNASHELRTPLTVINGYLETFADLPDSEITPRLQRAFDQMLLQSRRMMALINDLLMLSRLETQPKTPHADVFSLRPMLDSIAEEAAMIAPGEREIIVHCDSDVMLVGNSSEMRSAIANLVNNAVKYGKVGGHVWVTWFRRGEQGCLQVKDDGIGIDTEHVPHLTERFYRVDESRTVATGGTGLGLAIVKHVLMRHHATMTIDSIYGQGTTFTCIFPQQHIQLALPISAVG
jgi:two-component system phosphate regulon sensor histidine kinase PhoR